MRADDLRIETRGHGAPEIVLSVPRALNGTVKRIPGRYFDWAGKRWRAPLSLGAAGVVRELLDHRAAALVASSDVRAWLDGMTGWQAEATVLERDEGPVIAVTTVLGSAPKDLLPFREAVPKPGASRDGRSTKPRPPRFLLPFDGEGARLLDQQEDVVCDLAVMLACADLRYDRDPAAATIRLGEDDDGNDRLELIPGWSGRAHATFSRLPEAVTVEDALPRRMGGHGYRPGDATIDRSDTVGVPADPSLVPELDALLKDFPAIVVVTEARERIAGLRVEHERRIETIRLSEAKSAPPLTHTRAGEPLRLGGTLQPFQHAGVRYLLGQRGSFLADEQGLGKTVMALATLEVDGAWPAVVVCPAGMKLTWRREARRWLPHRSVAVLSGRGQRQWDRVPAADDDELGDDAAPLVAPADADLVVLNYELVAAHRERLLEREPYAVVFDESHYCKEPTTKRTKAALELAETVPTGGLRLALTGTPIMNRPKELTSQLRLIGRLEDFGSGAELGRRFRAAGSDRQARDRLHWHLRAHGYARRLKRDVLPQLPAKRQVEVPLSLANQTEYRAAQQDVIAWLRTQPLDLRELDAKIAAALRAEQLVRLNHLRRLTARGKLPGAMTWIEDFLAAGEPLVVFATHVEIQKALLERFPDAAHVLGSDDAEARDRAVAAFQAGGDDGPNLIVCSLRAAAQGITLTRASNVAFLELDWTPAIHAQAEDRCHRIGQRDAVTAWYLLAREGVDREMSEVLRAKREIIDAVTDGRASTDEPVSLAVVRALRGTGAATAAPDDPEALLDGAPPVPDADED